LEDFDNACSAYEKAIELGEDYLIHLNYAVTLALNDETERAEQHYEKFKMLFDNLEDTSDVDDDVGTQANLLKMALGIA
jgi:Bardet-Biedl syndrome 4 protein